MSETKSPRRVMLDTFKEILKRRNRDGRRYFIKRGSIAWPQFPFEVHPLAISIGLDDTDFGNRRQGGMRRASISLEIAAKMASEKEDPSIDEGVQDDLLDDAETSMKELQAAKQENDDPVIFNLFWETASASEFHDSRFLVQGVIVTFEVSY